MSDHRTEPFEGHEDDPALDSYEWDYEEEPERPSRVLWGRVVALVAFLVLAFLLGRATAAGDDDDRAERLGAVVERLEEENEQLRAELDAALAETPEPETDTGPAEEAPAQEEEEDTYVVQQGDTLRGIAQDSYGDAALDDCIAEANDINDPTDLRPGQELVIPPEADC
jgi:LysM repeat protein